MTEDGHIVGVATKLGDILLDPLQGLDLVEDTIVARHLMRALGREGGVNEEAEHTKTVVDGDEHHILGTPLLTVELWLRAEALAIATAMNPQRHRQFLAHLTRCLRPHIQIEAVLAESGLFPIAPLRVVATSILDGLEARTAKRVANLHALPRHDGLRLFPTILLDGRCGVRNAPINIHVRMVVSHDPLHLTTLDS